MTLYSNITIKGYKFYCSSCHIDDLDKRELLNPIFKKKK